MKVGIINSQSNVSSSQKTQISFKQRQIPNIQELSVSQTRLQTPKILKSLRQIIKIINKNKKPVIPKAPVKPIEELKSLSVGLKSNDINAQTLALTKLFKMYAKSESDNNLISKFVWNEMVPYVKAEDDKKLINLVLKIHKKIIPPSDSSIIDRIKLIEAIGNKSHINELESYTGKQPGIPNSVKNDDDYREKSVKRAAYQALLNML